jgi:hypothetical protein
MALSGHRLAETSNLNRQERDAMQEDFDRNQFGRKNFERVIACLMRGKGNQVESLTQARLGQKQKGWPPIVADVVMCAASGQTRDLVMPGFQRDAFMAEVEKTAVPGGSTVNIPALIGYQMFADGYFTSRRNVDILDAIMTEGVPMPFNTIFASTSAIGTGGAALAEMWWKVLTAFSFASAITSPRKAAAMVVLSNDLIRFKAPYASALMNSQLSIALANADAVDVCSVLLDGITPIASSNDARVDLAAALAAITLGQGSKPMIFASPSVVKELAMIGEREGPPAFPDLIVPNGGSISGMSCMAVDALANYSSYGDVLLVVDAARIAGDPGTPIIKVATAGSIQMSDAPTDTTSPSETASTMINLFQTDSTAIMLERFYSIVRPFADSVACISHAHYGTGSP